MNTPKDPLIPLVQQQGGTQAKFAIEGVLAGVASYLGHWAFQYVMDHYIEEGFRGAIHKLEILIFEKLLEGSDLLPDWETIRSLRLSPANRDLLAQLDEEQLETYKNMVSQEIHAQEAFFVTNADKVFTTYYDSLNSKSPKATPVLKESHNSFVKIKIMRNNE